MSVSRNILYLIIVVSTILFLLGILLLVLFPTIYERKLEEQTNIVQNSVLFDMWKDLPLPIYQRIYFFNITNSENFIKNGGIMEVEEVGPYTYSSHWVKEDIEWHPNGTVSFREVKTFSFVLEESIGSQEDVIYTLNGPLILAADFLKDKGPKIRSAADKLFRLLNEELVIQVQVKELAFEGYSDPIIRLSKFFRPGTPFKGSKFCWLYGRNATDDGLFNVNTGERNHSLLNVIDNWNGAPDLNFWKNETCNQINGSNGEFGPPLHEKQYQYTFFQPIFCRSLTFNYTGVQIHREIVSKRFQNNIETFSKTNPDNICFNIDPELDSGVLDISPCQFEAPVVLSFPHFYLADSTFLDNINGLNPNKKNHSSHIDVEPLSGVTIDLSVKFQMNVKMKPVDRLSMFNNVDPGVYPIFWIDLSAQLTDDLADYLKDQLYRPKVIAYVAIGCMMLVSTVMFVVAVWRLIKLKDDDEDDFFKDSEKEPLLKKSRESVAATYTGTTNESSSKIILSESDLKQAQEDDISK